ncbi:class I SAM-dependent RNA methyltransferase [Caulobacter sp. 17J80-11]|uniref:class I SAM-dependent RNA methyltransferase n=1 Tax=Caulobacter sp. 17J80-11 TaxID=2763502 RepID=UPI00165367A7|nr:class I SAM-dependent RNA methyltransferase [Caulobacter sp. 17J80-11]MBC6981797.1 class I SAM-dependent RNA methyltransferase [Caulobacter sp. 17J80-11]
MSKHPHKPVPARVEELEILSVGGQGDGVAAGHVFVPLTLPGERARVRVEGDRGEVLELLEASPERIAPVSPHYGECGGCALQHWAAEPYLAWKREQVRLALGRERLETEIADTIACPPASRRRLALHARPGKGGGAALGFKARRSWRLVEITSCPVADPALVRALPGLRALAAAFLEHPKSAPTLHVTATLSGLDVDVTGVERKSGGLSADRRMQAAEAAAAADLARVTMSGEIIYMARQPTVRFGPATVALPAGSFLQATPQAEEAMARLTLDAVAGAGRLADLFCGAGTFTFRMAELAPVFAADAHEPAVRALKSAIATAPGLKPITAETRDLFRAPVVAEEMKKIDAIVFDPPRAGAAAQTLEIARSKAATVVGISCNPATFARDARVLVNAGFQLEKVTPVDQFLWSPHIEVVGVFRR